jgi:hypothetical protein
MFKRWAFLVEQELLTLPKSLRILPVGFVLLDL